MRELLPRLLPRSLRGQLMAVIIIALSVVISVGSLVERIAKSDYVAVPNLELLAERAGMVAMLLREAPTRERGTILTAATHAGLDFKIVASKLVEGMPPMTSLRTNIGWLVSWMFPPDRPPPLGGQWLMVDNRAALVFELGDQQALVLYDVPETVLTTDFISPASYYFLALLVLPTLFSLFAVWAITGPLKRISAAVGSAEIDNGQNLFAESGSIEIVGLARALNTMRSRIRAMIDNRTRMLRSVSHDLRTPLTRLRLRAERLGDGLPRQAMLSDIRQIEGLIEETLNYLRSDVSAEDLQRVDLASVLQTVCSEFSDVGFAVTYRGPDRLPGWGKPNALARAITNLCDNGVKFASNVTVTLMATDDAAVIEVTDDGPGIPATVRHQVFEPFFKSDASRPATSAHGFGLGLSIVADIVHGHGGRIELDDNPPTGLIVRLHLPRAPAGEQAWAKAA